MTWQALVLAFVVFFFLAYLIARDDAKKAGEKAKKEKEAAKEGLEEHSAGVWRPVRKQVVCFEEKEEGGNNNGPRKVGHVRRKLVVQEFISCPACDKAQCHRECRHDSRERAAREDVAGRESRVEGVEEHVGERQHDTEADEQLDTPA